MYQITKMKDNKILWLGKSHDPQHQLSKEIENTHHELRPNWSELTDTQGIHFDIGGITYWVHKLQTNQ